MISCDLEAGQAMNGGPRSTNTTKSSREEIGTTERPSVCSMLCRNLTSYTAVELVLRGAHGFFLPTSWLMSTLCHEVCPAAFDVNYSDL